MRYDELIDLIVKLETTQRTILASGGTGSSYIDGYIDGIRDAIRNE